MKNLPRSDFHRLSQRHQSDKYSKGFDSWAHLTAMVYAQLSGASSLRVLEAGYNSQSNHHYPLGTRILRRSTLSEANATRPPELFADIVCALMSQAHRRLRTEMKDLLYRLDSTSFTLKGRGFDAWTKENRTRNTQGIKLHVLYEAAPEIPVCSSFTPANVNDRDEAVKLDIEPEAIYAFDKGYCDYKWWHHINQAGARFVTRFKNNAALKPLEERPVPEAEGEIILKDETVLFSNPHPRSGRKNPYRKPLRRVTVARPDHDRPLVLATNDLASPALQIASYYKARWGIELFFKWIKQHLKIKSFLGRSENAVKIQILTALITYLLLAIHRQLSGFKGSLWHWLAEVRARLFQRPSLEFLNRRRRSEHQRLLAQVQASLFS
jgi:IS4 transposase